MSFPVQLGTALQALGLSLMIGGLLALGAFTAPVLFKQFARPEAGTAMALIFRRYDVVLLAGAVLVMLGELLRLWFSGRSFGETLAGGWLQGFRMGALVALLVCIFYGTLHVNPRLETLQKAGVYGHGAQAVQEFQALHKRSEQVAKFQLSLAVVLLVLTPFL
jgi:hypothetical protein